MAAFMLLEDKNSNLSFAGESTIEGFVGWIELSSFRVGYQTQLVNGQRAGRAVYDHFEVTKHADKSTPAFGGNPSRNSNFKVVKVSLATSIDKETGVYLEYEFYDACIARYYIEADHQLRAVETVSFGYSGILIRYTIHDKDGVPKGTVETADTFYRTDQASHR